MDENQKIKHYRKLLLSRRKMFFSVGLLIAGSLIAQLFREFSAWDPLYLIIFIVPGVLLFAYYGIIFRTLEQCPWCNKKFMVEPNSLIAKLFYGRKWYKRITCANCGMPDNINNGNNQA